MEELIAQLLRQRSVQTVQAANAQHQALLQQLAPISEAQAYRQLDASRIDKSNPTWTLDQAAPEDLKKMGLGQRANPLPGKPTISAGDHASTAQAQDIVAPDLLSSADERNYRDRFAKPVITEQPDGPVDPSHGFTPSPYLNVNQPLDLVSDASMQRDDDVQQTGWVPADFNGMSHAAAAALIADQLRTRRIRQMGEMSPDFLQTLPQY